MTPRQAHWTTTEKISSSVGILLSLYDTHRHLCVIGWKASWYPRRACSLLKVTWDLLVAGQMMKNYFTLPVAADRSFSAQTFSLENQSPKLLTILICDFFVYGSVSFRDSVSSHELRQNGTARTDNERVCGTRTGTRCPCP